MDAVLGGHRWHSCSATTRNVLAFLEALGSDGPWMQDWRYEYSSRTLNWPQTHGKRIAWLHVGFSSLSPRLHASQNSVHHTRGAL